MTNPPSGFCRAPTCTNELRGNYSRGFCGDHVALAALHRGHALERQALARMANEAALRRLSPLNSTESHEKGSP